MSNYQKKKTQIIDLLNQLEGNYDLPENPNHMNGYKNESDIAEKILAKVGINKPTKE